MFCLNSKLFAAVFKMKKKLFNLNLTHIFGFLLNHVPNIFAYFLAIMCTVLLLPTWRPIGSAGKETDNSVSIYSVQKGIDDLT
jgi:hypothetical protein